jgi:hypothetical protein
MNTGVTMESCDRREATASSLPSTYPANIEVSLNRSFSVFVNALATNAT